MTLNVRNLCLEHFCHCLLHLGSIVKEIHIYNPTVTLILSINSFFNSNITIFFYSKNIEFKDMFQYLERENKL